MATVTAGTMAIHSRFVEDSLAEVGVTKNVSVVLEADPRGAVLVGEAVDEGLHRRVDENVPMSTMAGKIKTYGLRAISRAAGRPSTAILRKKKRAAAPRTPAATATTMMSNRGQSKITIAWKAVTMMYSVTAIPRIPRTQFLGVQAPLGAGSARRGRTTFVRLGGRGLQGSAHNAPSLLRTS
jgi:hypothetical protein